MHRIKWRAMQVSISLGFTILISVGLNYSFAMSPISVEHCACMSVLLRARWSYTIDLQGYMFLFIKETKG